MMYCLIFIGIGLVSLVSMFLQVKKKQQGDVMTYCLIFIGIGLVSLVSMFLQVRKTGARCDDVLSNRYWYRISQLGCYVLTGNTCIV